MKKQIMKLCLVLILIIPFYVKAEEKVTKESLTKSYRDVIACQKEGNYTEEKNSTTDENGLTTTITTRTCKENMDYSGINMDDYITNDKIFIDAKDGSKAELNYAIQDNGDVLFYSTSTIDSSTTYEQYQARSSDSMNLLAGYPIVAAVKGIDYNDSTAYISGIMLEMLFAGLGNAMSGNGDTPQYVIVEDDVEYTGEGTVIKKSEFGAHAVEYAKAMGGTEETVYTDADKLNTFSLTITPDVSDNTKYVMTSKLLVKSSQDFSGLNGSANKLIANSTGKNSLDPAEAGPANETAGDGEPTAYNPKTGALISIIPITLLFALGILLLLKSKNYFKKI